MEKQLKQISVIKTDHHVFCDYFGIGSRENCKQCNYLFRNFPYNPDIMYNQEIGNMLIEKYFPNVKIRK